MIPTALIERHAAYRDDAALRTMAIPRSDYWQSHSPNFWAELGPEGYRNLGQANYLPVMTGRPLDDQFPTAPHVFDAADNAKWMAAYTEAVDGQSTALNGIGLDGQIMRLGQTQFDFNSHMLRALTTLFAVRHHAGDYLTGESRILEIGAGAGIVPAAFHAEYGCRVAIVDLPEMLTVSSALIMTCFPDAAIVLPNEWDAAALAEADFVFALTNQIGQLQDLSFDLAMNTASFMEMNADEVDRYFRFIGRQLRIGGVMYSSNRSKEVRLDQFPWHAYAAYEQLHAAPNALTAHMPPWNQGGDFAFIDDIRRKVADAGN